MPGPWCSQCVQPRLSRLTARGSKRLSSCKAQQHRRDVLSGACSLSSHDHTLLCGPAPCYAALATERAAHVPRTALPPTRATRFMLQPGIHKQRYRITCRQVLHAPAGLAATTAAVAANGTAAPADAAVQLLRDSNGTTFEAYEMEHMFHVAALKGTVSEMDIFNWVAPHRKYLGAKVSQRKTLQVRSAMSVCFASVRLRCEMMMPWPDASSQCNGVSGVRAGLCTMHSAWPANPSLGLCMHAPHQYAVSTLTCPLSSRPALHNAATV